MVKSETLAMQLCIALVKPVYCVRPKIVILFFYLFLSILFISICHDYGVVQHELQKMFASKYIYKQC